MKILVVYQHYYPEPFRITDICETLVKNGHEVSVLTDIPNYPEGDIYPGYEKGKKRNEVINGVNVIRAFTVPRKHNVIFRVLNYYSYSIASSLMAKKLGGDYDVVLAYQTSPVMMSRAAIAYKKKYGKKVLLYCFDLWPASLCAGGLKKSSFIYRIYSKVSRKIYGSADILAAAYKSFFDYFEKELDLNKNSFRLIPQYAEELFDSVSQKKADGKTDLVFAGNIGKAQSVETIIKAAELLKKRTDIVFHIVGDGIMLDTCRAMKDELGLDNVIFYGRRPLNEMREFYSMADAMLLTLFNDEIISYTLPGKMQSYMAAAKPVLAAAGGETRRVIEESGCGLCCTAEDFRAFADNIVRFADCTNKSDYASNSRIYYEENYAKKKAMKILENALSELAGK